MKELESDKRIQSNENKKSPKLRQTTSKIVTKIMARAPTSSACEIPILSVLFKEQLTGVPTKTVLQEVMSEKWFKLSDDDLKARYPKSRRKIVSSVIKFSRKNLVIKGQILPVGEEVPIGTWKATRIGLARYAMECKEWTRKYSTHDAIIIEEKRN
ncbi:MAG TPA: hypothetical protein VN739_07970 [Nitrososphaerales archaeon]|nr:hypothetical protein [Nitrososphaerales archaeon]